MTPFSQPVLKLVGAAISLGFLLTMLGASSANNDSTVLDSPPVPSCWVFQHMVKSGGTTVRSMLADWVKENNVSTGEFSDAQWLRGEDFARNFVNLNYTVTYGEYAESLRTVNKNSENCKWWVMFRHPIPRLVSAFYYCKRGRGRKMVDPLCAHEVIDIDTADIATFAEHWGNYAVRQFVMPFMSVDEIIASRAARECRLQSKTNGQRCCGWPFVKLKMDAPYLNDTSPLRSVRPVDEDALYPYLKIAQDRISNFTAVGVVEDFVGSLHLFDRALDLQDFDWVGRYGKLGSQNTVLPASQDSAARDLQRALTDPSIKRFIALDLLLYEHAVDVHERQLEEYGLSPSAPHNESATMSHTEADLSMSPSAPHNESDTMSHTEAGLGLSPNAPHNQSDTISHTEADLSDCVGTTTSMGRVVTESLCIVALFGLLTLSWRSRSGLRNMLVVSGKRREEL